MPYIPEYIAQKHYSFSSFSSIDQPYFKYSKAAGNFTDYKGKMHFILYIRKDSNSSLNQNLAYQLKFTSYQEEKLFIFYFCEITKRILCGIAEPLESPIKK